MRADPAIHPLKKTRSINTSTVKYRTMHQIHACRHENPCRIERTHEGESVCSCGTVLEERLPEETGPSPKYSVSLYHRLEKGGDPRGMKVVNRRLHIYESSLSEFSNICGKLGMPDSVQDKAWSTYHKYRSGTYYSRAKCAMHSIFSACREAGIPVNEGTIQDTIQSVMGVKSAPNSLSVISEMREEIIQMGIDSNQGHSSEYYLNLEIKQAYTRFSKADADRFKIILMRLYAGSIGNGQDRALRASKGAYGEMGASRTV
ncbi:conserved hypothetical protein [Nitrosopumilaceae archaeon]|nr:conserved hypothetical protein [Nitrosopumilaceae archaeon]